VSPHSPLDLWSAAKVCADAVAVPTGFYVAAMALLGDLNSIVGIAAGGAAFVYTVYRIYDLYDIRKKRKG